MGFVANIIGDRAGLLFRLQNSKFRLKTSSTFSDLATAKALVEAAIDAQQNDINNFLNGNDKSYAFQHPFPQSTGVGIADRQIVAIPFYDIMAVLRKDPTMSTGYRIHTGYPSQ